MISLMVIALDQGSKQYVVHHFVYQNPVPLCAWLNITLNFNSGAAFSFLANTSDWHRWFLSGLALLISAILLVWIIQTEQNKKAALIAYTLILGGALSNLIDRFVFGYVIDFIDFHLGGWHFATFNLADSAITVGAILLGLLLIFKRV
tara:strand:+ start:56 stop:499 length:444 start_codon:yes stop_codon:yes gene_type:complete